MFCEGVLPDICVKLYDGGSPPPFVTPGVVSVSKSMTTVTGGGGRGGNGGGGSGASPGEKGGGDGGGGAPGGGSGGGEAPGGGGALGGGSGLGGNGVLGRAVSCLGGYGGGGGDGFGRKASAPREAMGADDKRKTTPRGALLHERECLPRPRPRVRVSPRGGVFSSLVASSPVATPASCDHIAALVGSADVDSAV